MTLVLRRAGASSPPRHAAGIRPASGPSLRSTSSPSGLGSSSAASCAATRATRAGSAVSPTQRIAIPPGRTSGRHHSAATGGWRERLCERHACPVASPAPRRVPRRPARSVAPTARGSAHLRCSASISTTSRSGSDTASGNARRAAARADIDDRAFDIANQLDRAQRVLEQDPARRRQIERGQPRRLDDGPEPELKRARRRGSDWAPPPRSAVVTPSSSARRSCASLPLGGAHRLERDACSGATNLRGGVERKRLDRRTAAGAVVRPRRRRSPFAPRRRRSRSRPRASASRRSSGRACRSEGRGRRRCTSRSTSCRPRRSRSGSAVPARL